MERMFAWLMVRFTTAPVLDYPEPTETLILDTNTSNVGLGIMLSQEGGRQRVGCGIFQSGTVNG